MPNPLTDKAYVQAGGGICPFCTSTSITGEPIEVDGNGAFQNVSCEDCNGVWMDKYQLTGYLVVEKPVKANNKEG